MFDVICHNVFTKNYCKSAVFWIQRDLFIVYSNVSFSDRTCLRLLLYYSILSIDYLSLVKKRRVVWFYLQITLDLPSKNVTVPNISVNLQLIINKMSPNPEIVHDHCESTENKLQVTTHITEVKLFIWFLKKMSWSCYFLCWNQTRFLKGSSLAFVKTTAQRKNLNHVSRLFCCSIEQYQCLLIKVNTVFSLTK